MSKKYITIQESSKISGKSIQTIRRGIKSKKFKFKKQKTPQGFNYLIDRESFFMVYDIKDNSAETEASSNKKSDTSSTSNSTEVNTETQKTEKDKFITLDHLKEFTSTLDKMMKQHSEERQNFVRLIGSLQEKIFVLENQVNVLQAPKKKWFQVWK